VHLAGIILLETFLYSFKNWENLVFIYGQFISYSNLRKEEKIKKISVNWWQQFANLIATIIYSLTNTLVMIEKKEFDSYNIFSNKK
jgi:hypothetical protein